MKTFAILYNFNGRYGSGTNEYILQADSLIMAKEKFYQINKGLNYKIKKIMEVNNK